VHSFARRTQPSRHLDNTWNQPSLGDIAVCIGLHNRQPRIRHYWPSTEQLRHAVSIQALSWRRLTRQCGPVVTRGGLAIKTVWVVIEEVTEPAGEAPAPGPHDLMDYSRFSAPGHAPLTAALGEPAPEPNK
jgi:hypothetical protein